MASRTPRTPDRPNPLSPGAVPAGVPQHAKDDAFLVVNADSYAWLPEATIDLVLTDPPFNIARETNFDTYEKNTIHSYKFDKDSEDDWDTYTHEQFIALLGGWAGEFARVLRKGGSFAVFCADAYVSHLWEALANAGLSPKRLVTWRKPNAVPINRKSLMMSATEYVIVGVKHSKGTFNADIPLADPVGMREIATVLLADKAAAVTEKAVRDALAGLSPAALADSSAAARAVAAAVTGASAEAAKRAAAMYVPETSSFRACVPNHVSHVSKAGNRLHPTEKPVPLLRYLAALLSRPGDAILDPFAGSGSTGEAALGLARTAVLVERDPEYYARIVRRLDACAK